MDRDMVSFVTLNKILGCFPGSVMCVSFEPRIMRELLDDHSADSSGFGIPPHVVTDDKCFRRRGNPLLLIQSFRSCVCDGRKQCVGILPGVESSVLYDDLDIGLDDACIVGPSRNWLRILQVVKSHVVIR